MKLRRTKADHLFSLFIRHRDKWRCQRCGIKIEPPTSQLQCSHFHSRLKRSVRFDLDNCCALCTKCHTYFDGRTMWRIQSHKEEHKEFMLKRLGRERFDALEARASVAQKQDEALICLWLTEELKKYG